MSSSDRAAEQFDDVYDVRFLHHGGTGFIRSMESGQSAKLLKHAKDNGLTVTFDLIGPHDDTPNQLKELLPNVDFFMPSMEEASSISGLNEPSEIARFFMDMRAGACIFKWSANGSYIKTKDRKFQVPAFEVPISDTSGCGDSYCGGFVAGLAIGYDLEQACRLGTATSGLVGSGLGSDAGVVDLKSTTAFMDSAQLLKLS